VSTGALLGPGRLAEEVDTVQWVTREHPKTDRIACPWLIRRFIDPHAEILYVPADQVLAVADRQQAISFDAPGARYTHRDGLCSFEVLVADYRIDDPAVALLAAPGLARVRRCRARFACPAHRSPVRFAVGIHSGRP